MPRGRDFKNDPLVVERHPDKKPDPYFFDLGRRLRTPERAASWLFGYFMKVYLFILGILGFAWILHLVFYAE